MTEEEWLACADPQPMLGFLRDKASDRKLRLFAVACCRSIWHLLPDERSREAIEVAERIADGTANEMYGIAATKNAETAMRDVAATPSRLHAAYAASHTPTILIHVFICQVIIDEVTQAVECLFDETGTEAMYAAALSVDNSYCELIRDIFGNPFHPVTIDPAWNNGTVRQLAQAIYDERAFDRMPILADALENAGCHNEEILAHCRGDSLHTRGCWAVDLLLGKK